MTKTLSNNRIAIGGPDQGLHIFTYDSNNQLTYQKKFSEFDGQTIVAVMEVSPDLLFVYSWTNCNVYTANLTTNQVEVHAKTFASSGGTEIKPLPGFNVDTFPFLFLRDSQSIYLLNTKEKNKVYKMFDIAAEGSALNNRLAISSDEDGSIKIATNDGRTTLALLKMESAFVSRLRKHYAFV